MKTFQRYLTEVNNQGWNDHALRANLRSGAISFYIHPHGFSRVDGDTLDFVVAGNTLYPNPDIDRDKLYAGLSPEVMERHAASVTQHIQYVRIAGAAIGVQVEQLMVHDLSKWSPEEFVPYAKHFQGGGAPVEFATAWLLHQNRNPHHWEYWITRSDHSEQAADGCLPMPEMYVREMVADWMGASMAYTGSWDMTAWLKKNLERIRLHPDSWGLTHEVLRWLGYADVVGSHP